MTSGIPPETRRSHALSLHCHRTGRFCDRTVIGLSMDRAAKYPEESCTVIALSSACAGGVMEDRQESCTVMEESWRSRRGHALYITSHGKSWKNHGNTRRSHSLSWQVRQLSRRSHSLSSHCDRTVIALSCTCHALVMDLSCTCHVSRCARTDIAMTPP